MYSFFIGCDISKTVFDAAYYHDGQAVYIGQFGNNLAGFKELIKQLKKSTKNPPSSWFICFENTGVYSKSILEYLCSQGIPCREENALRISRSMGLRRGKDDKIDAQDICIYAFRRKDTLQRSNLPKPLIAKLKKLLSRRDLLVRQKQSLEVTLVDQKAVMDPSLFNLLESRNNLLIQEYARQIKEIEQLIQDLIAEDEQVKTNYKLAQSVIGIGKITAAYMIALTENFTCFRTSRKFACYAGIAPFPNRSGIRVGKNKVSHLANKKMKSLLSNCVNAAIMYDKEITLYYQRQRAAGKEKGVVFNAIKNKIIHRVFAVVNRKTPYVPIMKYA